MRTKSFIATIAIILALTGCSSSSTSSNGNAGTVTSNGVTVSGSKGQEPVVTFGSDVYPPTALMIKDIYIGDGAAAEYSSSVTTHYVGYGLNTKQKFDTSWGRGEPVTFSLNQVIPGWTQGIPGMKVGGRRLLIIPAGLAYGANPPPGGIIQPNEPLVFVVDLTAVQ